MMDFNREIKIPVSSLWLKGNLVIPDRAIGLVIFSHGSGSSRLSPRNRYVADFLNKSKIATLLFDLLTEEEDETYENRFNIDLLTDRLIWATDWVKHEIDTTDFNVGYFGASTGAASALRAAAELGQNIKVVVSRGGRPDLAMPVLDKVKASTLLIVGGDDHEVIRLNEQALRKLTSTKKLEIVEGASHLFEEPGKLEKVAVLARDWFKKYLPAEILI